MAVLRDAATPLVGLPNVDESVSIGRDPLGGLVRRPVVYEDDFVGLTRLSEDALERGPDVGS